MRHRELDKVYSFHNGNLRCSITFSACTRSSYFKSVEIVKARRRYAKCIALSCFNIGKNYNWRFWSNRAGWRKCVCCANVYPLIYLKTSFECFVYKVNLHISISSTIGWCMPLHGTITMLRNDSCFHHVKTLFVKCSYCDTWIYGDLLCFWHLVSWIWKVKSL